MQLQDSGDPWNTAMPYFNSKFMLTKPDLGRQFEVYITMALNERIYPLQRRINDLEHKLIWARARIEYLARPWWKRWFRR